MTRYDLFIKFMCVLGPRRLRMLPGSDFHFLHDWYRKKNVTTSFDLSDFLKRWT